MPFERRLKQPGFGRLLEGPAPDWWRKIVDLRFVDQSGITQPLFLAVRDNYINAYVEGQSFFKISFPKGNFRAEIHEKYLDPDVTVQGYVALGETALVKDIDLLKTWMIRTRNHAREEKKGIAVAIGRNPQIVDVEMALPNEAAWADQMDIVALQSCQSGGINLVFYEAKQFMNGDLRAAGTTPPRVLHQLGRYKTWLEAPGRAAQLVQAYRRTCRYLVKFNEVRETRIDPLVSEAAKDDSILRVDTSPRLIIFGYEVKAVGPKSAWVKNNHQAKLMESGYRILDRFQAD